MTRIDEVEWVEMYIGPDGYGRGIEVFCHTKDLDDPEEVESRGSGWYWSRSTRIGIHSGELYGPFHSREGAIRNAQYEMYEERKKAGVPQ